MSIYWQACTGIKLHAYKRDGEYSEYIKIRRGVRQGCLMSLNLFNYYSEMILRELEEEKGLEVGGENITNLRYVDDTVLLAESVEDLQKLLDVVVKEKVS